MEKGSGTGLTWEQAKIFFLLLNEMTIRQKCEIYDLMLEKLYRQEEKVRRPS